MKLVVLTSMLVPAMPRLLDGVLFPRAAAMRRRLADITGRPVTGTRADTVSDLLRRVVEAVDCEGGMIMLEPAGGESAAVEIAGRADPTPLGASPVEVVASVADLAVGLAPRMVRSLPRAEQLRLAACDMVVVCPLAGERREATLLLGPRRGWPWDDATLAGLAQLGRHAGLVLENLTLEAARRAAERTSAHREKLAALGEAAARIAHEIRNPLSAARSLVQAMDTANGASDTIELTIGELDRIGSLVADLLAFARRDEVVVTNDVDLPAVCRRAVAQTAPLATRHAVTVDTELDEMTVRGDRDRLTQVIANLCRNAIEALVDVKPPRRVLVCCRLAPSGVVIEVQDTGPGIPLDELASVFEPFRTTKSSGTGLGLSIARRIVEAHGGRLVVESVPGRETVFRVALPAAGVAR